MGDLNFFNLFYSLFKTTSSLKSVTEELVELEQSCEQSCKQIWKSLWRLERARKIIPIVLLCHTKLLYRTLQTGCLYRTYKFSLSIHKTNTRFSFNKIIKLRNADKSITHLIKAYRIKQKNVNWRIKKGFVC